MSSSPPDTSLVLRERRDNVVLLALNRPERHHALGVALSSALAEALDEIEADESVACVILTGTGEKAFCAGGDMLEMSGVESAQRPRANAGNVIARVGALPMPVIAAINGYCFGGGARLAISCDIRLAAEHATFRLPGAEYGLVVAAATLPRLVGAARAKELIFTARKFGAHEAFDYGLVNAVYPAASLLPATWEMAATIASQSPSAIRESKRVIDAATLSAEAEQLEIDANRALRGSPEQAERFRAATRRVTGR